MEIDGKNILLHYDKLIEYTCKLYIVSLYVMFNSILVRNSLFHYVKLRQYTCS